MTNYKKLSKQVSRKVYKASGLRNPNKKGKISSSRILHDIKLIKDMLNTEKKRFNQTITTAVAVGQVSANASGHSLHNLTPFPAQGVGYEQRTGNSFKWTSSYLSFQFSAQPNYSSKITIKIQIVQVIGEPFSTLSNVMGRFIQPNKFISGADVYDNASQRDPDYFKTFRIIKTQYLKMNDVDIAGQLPVKTINIPLKFNNGIHVKFNDNSSTDLTAGQVFVLVTADAGNTNTISTLDVPIKTASSALKFKYDWTNYYVDN